MGSRQGREREIRSRRGFTRSHGVVEVSIEEHGVAEGEKERSGVLEGEKERRRILVSEIDAYDDTCPRKSVSFFCLIKHRGLD